MQRLVYNQVSFLETWCKRHRWAIGFETLLLIKNLFSQLLKPFGPIIASHTTCMKHWRNSYRLRWHNARHRWHISILHPAIIDSILIGGPTSISKISSWCSIILTHDVSWRFQVNCFSSCPLNAVIFLHSEVIRLWGGDVFSTQQFSLGWTDGTTTGVYLIWCDAIGLPLDVKWILFTLMLRV